MEHAGNEDFLKETEKKGIGTPATRASMIEKLISTGYVSRKGRQLIPNEDGINLIAILPEMLISAKTTAEWENALLAIEQGHADRAEFLEGIQKMVQHLMTSCPNVSAEAVPRFQAESHREVIGTCPRCGNPVYEGKKNFYCSSPDCHFSIWKEPNYLKSMQKKINSKMARELLKNGRTNGVILYSQKTKSNFTADLLMEDTGTYVNFKLEFPKKEKRT